MWATPSGAPTAPPLHGNQALAAGSETRRRSVDGCVCLRNSPRPCESRSHLSGFPSVNVGLAPPAWQWRLGGEDVNKHLSIGFVPFTTGVSQGDGTGSGFSGLEAQFAGDQTLAQYPNVDARILSIMDDFHLLGALRYLGPIFCTLSAILSDCVGVKIN